MSAVDTLYGIYRRLPVALQNAMVSGYGWVLHRRRYGPEQHRMLEFLLESQRWDRERLEAYQLQKLQETLALAARSVPYYREQWARIGFDPRDVRRVEDLAQLPVTEKEDVRANPEAFVSEEARGGKLFSGNTSGTTGKPIVTFKDAACYQRVWAFQERQRRNNGITGKRPRVSIGVRPVVPMEETRPPFWRHDWTEDNWLFSNFHISEKTLDAYVGQIAAIDPEEINAYPSGVYLVAAHALRRGITSIRPAAVVTCAETLYTDQRRTIEEAFQCRVADQYGAAEVPFWVGQCAHGTYHQSMEFGVMEACVGATPVWDEPGDAVGTGFVNTVQVLVRYRLGDSVVLSREWPRCACGWHTAAVEQIVGRIDDILYAPDGRALGRLDIVMKKIEHVLEAQLIQDARDHLTVKLVSETGVPVPDAIGPVRQRLTDYFGADMRLDFEWVDHIPRTAAGKYRYQINKVGKP